MLEHTDVEQWGWVPSSDNVADDCTRDTPNEKFNSERSCSTKRYKTDQDISFPDQQNSSVAQEVGNFNITSIIFTKAIPPRDIIPMPEKNQQKIKAVKKEKRSSVKKIVVADSSDSEEHNIDIQKPFLLKETSEMESFKTLHRTNNKHLCR
ncbi:hypothetical protein JTB14_037680 [Gonioctena quinquepunctata]|nr:hypothetical protein JTB14_037680 [Gonioctena quinquepunctata]